jgi:GT2 family glycosyltransferase
MSDPGEVVRKPAIVIVTYNRCQSLLETLRRLHSLEAPFPMVVDNASTDDTVARVNE